MSKQLSGGRGSRLINMINTICLGASSICMLFMAVVVAVNVIGRYFFRSPLPATIEYVGLAAAVLISLSLLPTELAEKNISVPIIIEKLGPRALKIFKVCSLVFSLCVVGILMWTGAINGFEMFSQHEKTAVLSVPLGPFRLIWAFGCLLMFVVLVIHLIGALREGGE